MKKKCLVFIVFCIMGLGRAFGASAKPSMAPIPDVSAVPSPVIPQNVDFSICNKSFKLNQEKLFYLTLASLNANRFTILEIQSNSGYIIFSVRQKQFLASVVEVDNNNSMLKITPCDNVYVFPTGVVQNMFKYIELNQNVPLEKLGII